MLAQEMVLDVMYLFIFQIINFFFFPFFLSLHISGMLVMVNLLGGKQVHL